jgi:potassium efflux system protein
MSQLFVPAFFPGAALATYCQLQTRRFIRACCWLLLLIGTLLIARTAAAQDSLKTDSATAPTVAPPTELDAAQRVEQAYIVLGRISSGARRGADTEELASELPTVEDNLKTIRQNLTQYSSVINLKQIRMFQVLLTDMQTQLGAWRTELATQGQRLSRMQQQLDSLTQHAIPAATDTTTALGRSTARLGRKQQRARLLLTHNQRTVTQLQTRVSDSYIQSLELQDEVREQSRRFSRRTLAPSSPPLWRAAAVDAGRQAAAGQLVRESYASQRRLLRYYFGQNWYFGVWMVVLGVGFFLWVFRNFRAVNSSAMAPPPEKQPFRYLKPVPVASALVRFAGALAGRGTERGAVAQLAAPPVCVLAEHRGAISGPHLFLRR